MGGRHFRAGRHRGPDHRPGRALFHQHDAKRGPAPNHPLALSVRLADSFTISHSVSHTVGLADILAVALPKRVTLEVALVSG